VSEPSFLSDTRVAYDRVAADYAERSRADLVARPLDRALLAAFAELVRTAGPGPVADLGCGPGHLTAHLRGLGCDAFGVDLSPEMVASARLAYPGLRFDEGSMTALEIADGALGGIVAWYSIIHLPPEQLPGVFAEFHRVLAPGGQLLLAFQVRDEPRHFTEAFGHEVRLDAYRLLPEPVVELLGQAGLVTHARLLREPDLVAEKARRAHLLAHRPR
jgi:SAM-dependent methyltransferase